MSKKGNVKPKLGWYQTAGYTPFADPKQPTIGYLDRIGGSYIMAVVEPKHRRGNRTMHPTQTGRVFGWTKIDRDDDPADFPTTPHAGQKRREDITKIWATVLDAVGGNQTETGRILGVSGRYMYGLQKTNGSLKGPTVETHAKIVAGYEAWKQTRPTSNPRSVPIAKAFEDAVAELTRVPMMGQVLETLEYLVDQVGMIAGDIDTPRARAGRGAHRPGGRGNDCARAGRRSHRASGGAPWVVRNASPRRRARPPPPSGAGGGPESIGSTCI